MRILANGIPANTITSINIPLGEWMSAIQCRTSSDFSIVFNNDTSSRFVIRSGTVFNIPLVIEHNTELAVISDSVIDVEIILSHIRR